MAPLLLFVVIAFMDLRTALILLVMVPIIPLVIVAVQKIAKRILSRYWERYLNLGDRFVDDVRGLMTLKMYDADAQAQAQMDQEAESFRKATMRLLMMQLNSLTVMDLVAMLGSALGILSALSAYRTGGISLWQGIWIILIASEFFIPMRQLGSYFHVAMNGASAADRMFEFLDVPQPPEGEQPLTQGWPLSVQHLDFGYTPQQPVLKDVSLTLSGPGFYGLVGVSGSGKSTLASLLMGCKYADQGYIHLANMDIKQVSRTSLYQHIQLVRSEPSLFSGTIGENLRLGQADLTEKDMWFALQEVGLDAEVRAMGGLQTEIGENGRLLSGGQRQRLAIARALCRCWDVLILDEATSAVDREAEAIILETLNRRAKTAAILMITHRIRALAKADYIWLLAQGTIKAEGTPHDLRQKCRLSTLSEDTS